MSAANFAPSLAAVLIHEGGYVQYTLPNGVDVFYKPTEKAAGPAGTFGGAGIKGSFLDTERQAAVTQTVNRLKNPEAKAAIIRFQCTAESLVGSSDTVFALYRITYSGGTVAAETLLESFTWDGAARLAQFVCEHAFATSEGYQLRITAAGAHNLASIQPIGSSTN